jgi:hypothetical protein
MKSITISVAHDFTPSPAGRVESDGPFPGAKFRDQLLVPALKEYDEVIVDLDETDGFGSSFLEEAFGGLIRLGFDEKKLRKQLKFKSERQSYEIRAWRYIKEARPLEISR